MDSTTDQRDFERVLWRSRRGMLELDLLLSAFARDGYPRLGPELQRAYRDMLAVDDWTLWDWLQRQAPPEPAFRSIVGAIVAHGGGERR